MDIKPILNNLVPSINSIHDPNSHAMQIIEQALHRGMVVIFDISRLDSQTARWLSSMIVMKIFNRNKENFIKHGGTDLVKATFVLEEAHNVLGGRKDGSSAPSAFVDLAKEGRKYNLGGIFITQQPGSIPTDIVSQGDNFFVFHLLSRADLISLSSANAHYSRDIITQILSEPIRGKSYMWTSHQPFVIPIMVKNFEVDVQPNNSVAIQTGSTALSGILDSIRKEENNPLARSVYAKFTAVDCNPSTPKEKKGPETFMMLTDEEKEYLQGIGALQDGHNDKPFALTYSYQNKLRAMRLSGS